MLTSLIVALIAAPQSPLDRVPARKAEWQALARATPIAERSAVEYLLAYMPIDDLRSLPTEKVKSAAHLATLARKATQWGKTIPQLIYLDAVVPYASVTEPRRSMRAEFQKKYLPLVLGTKTPGEAALLVNQSLFKDYKVSYNTRRLRTDQSPPETIAQGMATCTGLSIMLVDALRAVGVPSRLAGIPSWPGRGGNHTWVEVWDSGSWHYVGAAEPDPKGLDHAWFTDDAGKALPDVPQSSIYAVTYRPTGAHFPLVWNPGYLQPAENVTKRYRHDSPITAPRLMVEVKKGAQRVEASVVAVDAATGDEVLHGTSLGVHADINLHLSAPAIQSHRYLVTAHYNGRFVSAWANIAGDTVVRLDLSHPTTADLGPLFADRFGSNVAKASIASKLLASQPTDDMSLLAAWEAFKASPDAKLRAEFDDKTVSTSDRTSPYLWRTVGEKPKDGWGLVIAMHGGGNGPKSMNDGEWKYMFEGYYRDHPEAGGYIYLALRAPNDTWNGFYDDSICPLVERLILQFVKFADVDPNRVYTCGASHGGYGAFVIGPKIPYRFAAIHPAASAGTDGETEGINLRNVRFTWAVGEHDTAYGRHDRCLAFDKQWQTWRATYGGFDGGLEEVTGAGHIIGKHEVDKLPELLKYRRNPSPKRVIWAQTDNVLHRFYWLEALSPTNKGRIDATVTGNTIRLTTSGQGDVALWLSSSLVRLREPVPVERDGHRQLFFLQPSLDTFCDGLVQTGDPELSGVARIVVK